MMILKSILMEGREKYLKGDSVNNQMFQIQKSQKETNYSSKSSMYTCIVYSLLTSHHRRCDCRYSICNESIEK